MPIPRTTQLTIRRPVALALAALAAVVAMTLAAWVDDRLGRDTGFIIPTLAVIVAAVAGGLWPGLLATTLIALLDLAMVRTPDTPPVGGEPVRVALFVLGGVVISALCELGLRGRATSELTRRAEQDARRAAERAGGRATALAALSATLGPGLSVTGIAQAALASSIRVVGAARGAFYAPAADGSALDVVASEGYPDEVVRRYRSTPLDARRPQSEAARTRAQVLVGTAAAYHARFPGMTPLVPEAPTVAVAAQPLLADDRLLGVLVWAFTTEQSFDLGTGEFLEAIGALTVQAIQGAAAFEREQTARRMAEAANRRLDLILQAGQALGATLDYDATLVAMARVAIPLLGDVCVADLLEQDRVRRFVAATDQVAPSIVATLEAHPVDPTSDHPVALAMRSGAVITHELDEDLVAAAARDETHRDAVERSGVRRILVVPLVVRDRALGALTFGTLDPHRAYGDADVALAEGLAQRGAKALENARLHGVVRQLASHERARAAELEQVLSAIGEGIVVLGPDGGVRSANAAAVRVLGGPMRDLDALVRRLGPGAAALARHGQAFGPEEIQVAVRPGTWVEVTAYPTRITAPAGTGGAEAVDRDAATDGTDEGATATEELGSVLVIRDVTAFRQGQGLREAFLGLLSHELRTPVTSIYAAATVLGRPDRALGEEVRADILTDIVAESDRLYRLVEDLLVLARFDEGLDLVREPSLLQRVVPSVVASEQPRWPRTRLEVRVDKDLPAVTGDETSIQQVIRNLVSNAAKYGPPGRPVEVVVDAPDRDGVRVRVLDHGPGIAEAEAEAVFAPFYRSPSTARVAGGAGIGLYVCRRLVEAMSGRIWARARDGGGSEFGFWLPRYVHAEGDEADDDAAPRAAAHVR